MIEKLGPDNQLSLDVTARSAEQTVSYSWCRRPLTHAEEAEVDSLADTTDYEHARRIVAGRDYVDPGEEPLPTIHTMKDLSAIEAAIDREDGFGFNVLSIRRRHGG